MFSKYGIRHGVMRGFWITVLREMPAYAGFYAMYEYSKRTLHARLLGPNASADTPLPVWATLTAGASGGIAYWTACYPFDVVKSRVQNTTTPLNGIGYIGDTFRAIYREGGWKAFVRGITPTCECTLARILTEPSLTVIMDRHSSVSGPNSTY